MARRALLALSLWCCLASTAHAELTRRTKIGIAVVVPFALAASAIGAGLIASSYSEYNAASSAPTLADFRRMTRESSNVEIGGVALLALGQLVGNIGALFLTLSNVNGSSRRSRANLWIAPAGMGLAAGGAF